MNLQQILLTCEIHDGLDLYAESLKSPDLILRENNAGLMEAFNEYMKAKEQYDMLLTLIKGTERFM